MSTAAQTAKLAMVKLSSAIEYTPGIHAVLYTTEINGTQTCRDDLWLATTTALNALAASRITAAATCNQVNADLLQELRNIANADTAEWDDRTEFEAWAKSRARAAIAKVNAPDSPPSPAWCASVDAELAATAEADAVGDSPCETCQGSGEIDETLGGYSFSNRHAECPDCDGDGVFYPRITLPATAIADGAQLDGESLEQAS